MNIRLTVTAAAAVLMTAVSLHPLIQGSVWFWAGAGAVATAAAAGMISRVMVLPGVGPYRRPATRASITAAAVTLIAVVPMLTAPSWALRAAGIVILAIPVAVIWLRTRLLLALTCIITYLALLAIYLNLVLAASRSLAGVIPDRASAGYLISLLEQGMAARSLAPPVAAAPGVVLLAAGGIGLIAAITDLLAVRLRQPALAGIALLALFCVRIVTNASLGGISAALLFCLGLAGYLALLAVEGHQKLRSWGTVVTVWDGRGSAATAGGVDTRALSASGRRIGLAAACMALVIPLAVPGITVHDLLRDSSGGAGATSGGHPVSLPNPLVQMRSQLLSTTPETVLTYRTTAANPPEQYLQVYVLNYSGASGAWTLGPLGRFAMLGRKPVPVPGLAPDVPTVHPSTRVTFSRSAALGYGSRLTFLPVPYAPSTAQISAGTWVEDDQSLMVYSGGTSLSGLSYTASTTEVHPNSRQLAMAAQYPASIASSYMNFPAGPGGQLSRLALQITAGAQTPYQKALKLQSYFTSGAFTYNVTTNLPNNIAGLDKFLFTTKAGMCQQFSFAMAALARLAGIPSRIAVGYTAGSRTASGAWRVTTNDAHSWPELYFTGVGWLRFEPTPGGVTGQGTATAPQYAPGAATGGPAPPPGLAPTGVTPGLLGGVGSIPGERRAPDDTVAGPGHLAPKPASSQTGWILLAVALALLAALISPMIVRAVLRRRRRRTHGDGALAHAAWRELRDTLADYGFGSPASESPRAVARRITATVALRPAASEALGRIASAEERARYAPAPLSSATLRADISAATRALAREASFGTRVRAVLAPRSVLSPVRSAVQHALDVFGWMDTVGLRPRFAGRHQQ